MKVVLFDIDGTLMSTGGAGTRAMNFAFEELFGIPDAFRGISMSGKTDPEIMNEAFTKHSIHPDGKMPALLASYTEFLRKEILNPNKKLMPGIAESIEILSGAPGFALGLLTGNIEEGARVKLSAFNLSRYFPFGAFGSDHHDRNKLLPIAVERFNSLNSLDLSYKDFIIVGDTPRDIDCAKPYGAFAFCVATGKYTSQELLEAGADQVFSDLSDTGKFILSLNKLT